MPASRHLPAKVNPLMTSEIPSYDTLVARRRLAQELGTFDYAHLRAPLPKGIHSGIFKPSPASYFLMRRSNDGFISATGMFKATFPYSETAEEEMERRYIKSLPTTSIDETAGNVWIPPHHALELAEEYQILPWIKALLDNAPIEVNPTKDQTPKSIAPPPKFDFKDLAPIPAPKLQLDEAPQISPPEALAALTTKSGRPRRSASPSKYATSSPRKIARARKPSARLASLEPVAAATNNVLEQVEMPAGTPDLPLPEDTEAMIAKAKEMVEAAVKQDAGIPTRSKRKAEEYEEDEEEEETLEVGTAKKVKVAADLKKERVKTRALIGLSATLAIGAMIPYVFGAF
ncbi:KilA-N domain-containing protein [Botrytis cinerea]